MTAVSAPVVTAAPERGARWSGSFIAGAVIIGLVILAAIVSFFWTPYDPTLVGTDRLLGPSAHHWLGTDALGRDVFSQILAGSRITLYVGVIAVGVGAVIGIPLGMLAAAAPRWLGEGVMRFVDLMLAFPALLLAVVFAAAFGASTLSAMIAIGIATAPQFARLSRSSALQVMRSEYVMAARIAGRPTTRIVMRHVLPNIFSVLIVQASVSYGIAVLAESGLSYLGFGTPPPTPSWGRMLQEAQPVIFSQPLLSLWPAAAIAVAVLGFNLLGDGLRDRFDPKLEDRR